MDNEAEVLGLLSDIVGPENLRIVNTVVEAIVLKSSFHYDMETKIVIKILVSLFLMYSGS